MRIRSVTAIWGTESLLLAVLDVQPPVLLGIGEIFAHELRHFHVAAQQFAIVGEKESLRLTQRLACIFFDEHFDHVELAVEFLVLVHEKPRLWWEYLQLGSSGWLMDLELTTAGTILGYFLRKNSDWTSLSSGLIFMN